MATLSQFFGDAVASGQSEHITDPRKFPAVYCRYPRIKTNESTIHSAYQYQFWNAMNVYRNINSADLAVNGGTEDGPAETWATNMVNSPAEQAYAKAEFFDTRKRGEVKQYTTADIGTYKVLCDITNETGHLAWVVTPSAHGIDLSVEQPDTAIRITVDGIAYEFTAQFIHYQTSNTLSRQRLIWGNVSPGSSSGANFTSMHSWGSYYDPGTYRNSADGYIGYGHNGVLYSPSSSWSLMNPWGMNLFAGVKGLRFENSIKVEVKMNNLAAMPTAEFAEYAAAAWTFDYKLPGF